MAMLIEYAIPEAERRVEKAGTAVWESFFDYKSYLRYKRIDEQRKALLEQVNHGALLNFEVEAELVERDFTPHRNDPDVRSFLEWLDRYKKGTRLYQIRTLRPEQA